MNQKQIAKLTLAAYASVSHKDIYRCGCEYPNGLNSDLELEFVCDACYEAAHPEDQEENFSSEDLAFADGYEPDEEESK